MQWPVSAENRRHALITGAGENKHSNVGRAWRVAAATLGSYSVDPAMCDSSCGA